MRRNVSGGRNEHISLHEAAPQHWAAAVSSARLTKVKQRMKAAAERIYEAAAASFYHLLPAPLTGGDEGAEEQHVWADLLTESWKYTNTVKLTAALL